VRLDGSGLVSSAEPGAVLRLTLAAGLAYNVSKISLRLIWRFVIPNGLLIRPPQFSAGLPGHGWLQEP
jgi:hypothetical protein